MRTNDAEKLEHQQEGETHDIYIWAGNLKKSTSGDQRVGEFGRLSGSMVAVEQ